MKSRAKFAAYNEAQEQLFREWYQKQKTESPDYLGTEFRKGNFSRDGIIAPEYFDQEIRILYLMVEENLTHGTGKPPYICDFSDTEAGQRAHALRVVKKENMPGCFYNNLSRLQALIKIGEHKEVPVHLENLLGAAIVNINKRGGYASRGVSGPMAERYAEEYGDFIAKQIKLIDPDVIICGQTYSILSKILSMSKDTDLCYNDAGYFTWEDCIVFDYYHPSARFRVDKYCREKHNNKIWIGDMIDIINNRRCNRSGNIKNTYTGEENEEKTEKENK